MQVESRCPLAIPGCKPQGSEPWAEQRDTNVRRGIRCSGRTGFGLVEHTRCVVTRNDRDQKIAVAVRLEEVAADQRRNKSSTHRLDVEPDDREAEKLDDRRWRRNAFARRCGHPHDRDDDRLLVAAGCRWQHQSLGATSAIRAILPFGRGELEAENRSGFLSESRPQRCEFGRPRRGFEHPRLAIPDSKGRFVRRTLFRSFDEVDRLDDLGSNGTIRPQLIARRVIRPRPLLDGARLELQFDDGPADFSVEVLGKLRRCCLKRTAPRSRSASAICSSHEYCSHASAGSRTSTAAARAVTPDTRVRRFDHSGSLACEKWPKIARKPLFTSLTTSLPRLNV